MANKLAGQRAKFSRARATYYSASDDNERARAARLMAEVLADAPSEGFTEEEVTQSEDVPDEVRRLPLGGRPLEEDRSDSDHQPWNQIVATRTLVLSGPLLEFGLGPLENQNPELMPFFVDLLFINLIYLHGSVRQDLHLISGATLTAVLGFQRPKTYTHEQCDCP